MGELWPLVARTKVERVDKNQVLFREGDSGDSVYIIRNGQVKLSKTSGDRELVIAYLVAGSVFGESALLGSGKRGVTVGTRSPSELISLQRKDFDAFVGRFPGLRAGLEADARPTAWRRSRRRRRRAPAGCSPSSSAKRS